MGGYFVDVCMQYPSVWTHLQRPGICVQISRRFVTNILLGRCTAVTRYVPHIPGNISANVADGACLCICLQVTGVEAGQEPGEAPGHGEVILQAPRGHLVVGGGDHQGGGGGWG